MRSRSPHRGVTLVEMLVSVALLVLMMTILVTIFGAATGALSGLQAFQQLDGDLRQLDTTIRQDLIGITARMTPPLDPAMNLGYFEVGENALADLQGEDTDDYIRFTAKAPEGQLFTGRMWTAKSSTATATSPQPIYITSQYAEIIYFLRNGNLYRRVLLIAPDRQPAVNTVWTAVGTTSGATFTPPMFGGAAVGWQGVNDLSAHPAPSGTAGFSIVLNTLGDLTNRENRFAYPRFANDYTGPSNVPDGTPDDRNPDVSGKTVGDGVPDYWPTLYPTLPSALLNESTTPTRFASSETMAFPYIFPGAYSWPDTLGNALTGGGWIHSLDPNPSPAFGSSPSGDPAFLDQLKRINHSPLETGDSLAPPAGGSYSQQTWWGFPTWKETLMSAWNDPTVQIFNNNGQANGLHPFAAGTLITANTAVATNNLLPPMSAMYRMNPQPLNDGMPTPPSVLTPSSTVAGSTGLWQSAWEDDLILTGVRSFDIKVYDDAFAGYADLGWGNDLRLFPTATRPATPQYLTSTPLTTTWLTGTFNTVAQTMAHEGRMPPLTADQRLDANYPYSFAYYAAGNLPYPAYTSYTGNIGDDGTSVIRLRRVWDSWSTDYTQAPATGFDPTTKLPVGPPWSPPIYPSYPPPYPAPLRGIQIQVRVTDPRSQRVKVLTIRQDFSDKL